MAKEYTLVYTTVRHGGIKIRVSVIEVHQGFYERKSVGRTLVGMQAQGGIYSRVVRIINL
jgi:hypothetical protein